MGKITLKEIRHQHYVLTVPYPSRTDRHEIELARCMSTEIASNFVKWRCNKQIEAFLEYRLRCYDIALDKGYDVPKDRHIALKKYHSKIATLNSQRRDCECFGFIAENELQIRMFMPHKANKWNEIIPESMEFYRKHNKIN